MRHLTRPDPASPSAKRPDGQPLASVAAGSRVRVLDLAVERSVARRLADLGLTIGSTARVMQVSSTAVILAARGSRLALGRPLAETIRVVVASGEVGT